MLNTNLDSKVLIVGGGPVGLFTALQLCQLNVPILVAAGTDYVSLPFGCATVEESPGNDRPFADIQPTSLPTLLSCSIPARDCPGTILLLSPRALQLLQSLNLYDDTVASGVKHWQLQIHTSTATTTATAAAASTSASSPTTPPMSPILKSAASLDTIHSYKLWENKATDQNFCLSIERSKLCHLLEDALTQRHGIQVDYDCELVDVRHGGGVENIVYMENELDSDFYLGNDQLLADATTPITCSTSSTKAKTKSSPVMVTIKQQENQHNHQRIRICQTQYVVVTCGKSSLMRQRLAGVACEGRQNLPIQRKASAISTTSNKKIADTINEGRYFYSMVAKVETDYPGIKPVSIVAKPEGTLIILVHNDYASMMIQQNKATVNDDDKGPMSLTKAQKVIQQLLQPYEIRFLEIYDYCYWEDPRCYTRLDTAPDRSRTITLGNASLDVWPNGWILPDMGFEQAVNLCWKLDLDIRQRSMPQLLDTYHEETRIKKKDASMASDVLLRLLSDPFAITQGGGMTKLLQGHRHCFIGGMLLENNELNMDCPRTRKVQRGSVGTLAPNGRLKPYNLNQLLTQQTSNHHRATTLAPTIKTNKKPNHQSITSLAPNSDNSSHQSDTNISSTNKLKFLRGLFTFPHNKKNQPAPVAVTGTMTPSTALASATASDKWRGIRANHYHLWDQLPSHTGDTNLQQSTFTILVLCGSLLDSNSLLALRRLKKHLDQPNSFLRMFETAQHQYSHHQQQQKHHHQQQQQQQQQQQKMTRSKSTPTDSSRSTLSDTVETSPAPPQSKLRQTQQPRRSESSSSFYSVRSNSSSTDESISNDSNPLHYRDSINTNLQSHRSSLFTRFSSSSNTDRYSMATTISNSSTTSNSLPPPLPSIPTLPSELDNQYSASPSSLHTSTSEPATPPPSSSSPSSMFSFVCLTTSSKSECSQFLSEQTPYSLHQLFPFGLTKTFLDHDQQCHQSYAIKDQQHPLPTLVVIRRDGYVGARIDIRDQPLYELDRYFDRILLPVVDFSSAAALVADDYCL